MTDAENLRSSLLEAALENVPFDGWSEATFHAALAGAEITADTARTLCPRGALDLAVAFHRRGDAAMLKQLKATDLSAMRMRDKIAAAVRIRLQVIGDKEAVRRGSTLFALPQHAAEGAGLIWGTADAIWLELGDSSDDINWYTKRATLSGVYAATVLFWLGDDSDGHRASWAFLDRRVDDVMQIEKIKARMRENPALKRVFAGPSWLLGQIKAPSRARRTDLPGQWNENIQEPFHDVTK